MENKIKINKEEIRKNKKEVCLNIKDFLYDKEIKNYIKNVYIRGL